MTSPTSSTPIFAPIPRKKRPLSTSTNSSPSTHSSIYDASPCSSPSPPPSTKAQSRTSSYTAFLDPNIPTGTSNTLPTIREQKSAILPTKDDLDYFGQSFSSIPLLTDPYASSVSSRDSTEFIDTLERYFGSPSAPLLPTKKPPPPLPPIPDNVTTIQNGRVMSVNARPWRPGPSGHRSYGTLGGHPFHHAPVAEVGGQSEEREEDEAGVGCWKMIVGVLCCGSCWAAVRELMVGDDEDE
ncbi:hypothetical protein BJ508DRAFT_309790 [Ascobolus immersus RN42]|uniref:Uncharacterized protein n=1 Tax=Ascobolus immersus RN42 TaxID=1160509 RepID=A0A3N4HVX8_ASCIM|nr:hypothetical protein BJ508DRAFT_309790 [Ascobolus immersus RN42]